MAALTARITAIVGSSMRLRDEALKHLLADWPGPVERHPEPDDLTSLLAALDSPTLFGDPPLLVVRGDERWLKKVQEALAVEVTKPPGVGRMILLLSALDGRSALAKALGKSRSLVDADGPDERNAIDWTVQRLTDHPQGALQARELASVLVEVCGAQADALLMAIDVLAIHAGDDAISPAGLPVIAASGLKRPPWELSSAVLEARAPRAIDMYHAGGKPEPEAFVNACAMEVRRLLACAENLPEEQLAEIFGKNAKGWVIDKSRQRARGIGRPTLLRLLGGLIGLQRQLRTSGTDADLAVELFVLHAQRLLRPPSR